MSLFNLSLMILSPVEYNRIGIKKKKKEIDTFLSFPKGQNIIM